MLPEERRGRLALRWGLEGTSATTASPCPWLRVTGRLPLCGLGSSSVGLGDSLLRARPQTGEGLSSTYGGGHPCDTQRSVRHLTQRGEVVATCLFRAMGAHCILTAQLHAARCGQGSRMHILAQRGSAGDLQGDIGIPRQTLHLVKAPEPHLAEAVGAGEGRKLQGVQGWAAGEEKEVPWAD